MVVHAPSPGHLNGNIKHELSALRPWPENAENLHCLQIVMFTLLSAKRVSVEISYTMHRCLFLTHHCNVCYRNIDAKKSRTWVGELRFCCNFRPQVVYEDWHRCAGSELVSRNMVQLHVRSRMSKPTATLVSFPLEHTNTHTVDVESIKD